MPSDADLAGKKIKPLTWIDHAGYSRAHTPWGAYTANFEGWWLNSEKVKPTRGRDAAKAACEADWHKRMSQGLEDVGC